MEHPTVLCIENFYPVAIWVFDKSKALHGASTWLLLEFHSQLLPALAGRIHIWYLLGTAILFVRCVSRTAQHENTLPKQKHAFTGDAVSPMCYNRFFLDLRRRKQMHQQ